MAKVCGIKTQEELKESIKAWSEYRTKAWSKQDHPKEFELVTNIIKAIKENTLNSLAKAGKLREELGKISNGKMDKTKHRYISEIIDYEGALGDKYPGAEEAYTKNAQKLEILTDAWINKLNRNNPRMGPKGAKLDIVSGIRKSTGEIIYQVKFPNSSKLYPISALEIVTDQVDAQLMGSDSLSKPLKFIDGDTIKLFSQIDVDGGHVTLDFNPEGENNNGPKMPDGVTEGSKVKVVKYGEFKDDKMAYDVVYIEKDGKKYYEQADGRPYHITRYINKEAGIKPFMTGLHAKEQVWNKENKLKVWEGEASYGKGTYNIKFDKSLGSDADIGIGSKTTDVFIGQEELHLGQVLREEFDNYYAGDVAAGNEIQTQEFNDLQDLILDTYEKTMQELGKGKVGLRLFESTVDNTAAQIDLRSKEMHIRWNKMSRLSRVSEVFLHEVNHLMSSNVFKNNRKLRALMENLRDSAVDSGVTYKLFLEGTENPTPNEVAIAKMKFEYTFDKTANPEEFYAYATTNEQVYNAIKDVKITTPLIKQLEMDPTKKEPLKKVLNKLIEIVNSQWRMLTGRGVLGGKMIADMVLTIAKLDADATIARRNKTEAPAGITDYAKGKINQLDAILEPVIKQADMWSEKFSAKQSAKWLGNHIKRVPILNDLLETGISQYLWRMVTQDTTTTDVADMYMVFRHAKQKVEVHTAKIRNGVKKVVMDLYADVDEGTQKAVAKIVLEGDLAQFTVAELKEYLENSEKRDADIAQMELELDADEATMKQINGLVEYLLTGVTTVHNQQINANNIVSELFKSKKRYTNANKELVRMVDRLVSLKVLQRSDKTQVELLSKLNEDTLDKTIQMYRGYIDNMRDDATLGAYDPIPKGYTRPEDGLTKYELIPEEEIKAQQSIRMKGAETDEYVTVEGKRYYLMTGMVKSVGFNEGAIGLISHTTEGIPVSSLIRKNNELAGNKGLVDGELRRRTKQTIDAINNQDENVIKQFKLGVGQSLVPVYDHQYRIVDYRIQLTKLEKEIHLPDRKTELSDLMSHTFSRSIKTSLTATQNKRVVDTIIEHSAKGIMERPEEYLLIEEYTDEDKMNGVKREKRHDRWEYLPDHTKDYIFQKLGSKSIYIHKDFVELMTGEKDVTIGNFAKFGIDLKKYPVAKARLMALESYLAEILGYVKNAMVVLNADVLLGNQTSNAIVAMTHGIDPITYTKKFKQRWEQLNEYNEKIQQLAELEVKRMAGENVDNRMKQLKRQLEGNIWDELVKDGQYTALVEDINIENQSEGQLYTMVNDYIEKKNWKGAVTTLRNMLYIDRTSALYGSMLKTVHYGDAITRQIIKEELEKKEIKKNGEISPKAEREILNYLDQLLVNYGYTMNRWVRYSERIGGLFFMKYYLSQAKAITSMAKRTPTMIGLIQGAQYATKIDIQDPFDTYLRSGIDGIAYRFMLDDAPLQLVQPNIWDLVPDISSMVKFN